MKRFAVLCLSLALLLSAAACGSQESAAPAAASEAQETFGTSAPASPSQESSVAQASANPEASGDVPPESASASGETPSNILIAYFTMPEDVDPSGADAVASASIVVRDGEALGSNQFVAELIQSVTGGDLFEIRTEQQYPLDHDPLVDQASDEQAEGARPALAAELENPDQYDTILLGYPNWWGDMPMPLYTFLERYDFSGKTIIPFCTHGGSGFSGTVQAIAELQPNATVSEDGLLISRNDVADTEEDIIHWAEGLNS